MQKNDRNWNLKTNSGEGDQMEFEVEDVREHLARIKEQVDTAGIPGEPYEVNMAEKVRAIVDVMLEE